MRTSLFLVSCLALLSLTACSDDGASASPANSGGTGTTTSQACTSDADCPAGEACAPTTGPQDFQPPGYRVHDQCTADQCAQLCAGVPSDQASFCLDSCLMAPCDGGGAGGGPGAAGSPSTGGFPGLPAAGSGGAPTSGGGSGVCRKVNGSSGGSGGSATATMSWTGTWNLSAQYKVKCDYGLGNVKEGEQSFTVAVELTGSNSSLTAQVASDEQYTLKGTGDDAKATLSGQFPFRDHTGDVASGTVTKDNSATLSLQPSSSKEASGSLRGQWKNQFGADCTIDGDGALQLTR